MRYFIASNFVRSALLYRNSRAFLSPSSTARITPAPSACNPQYLPPYTFCKQTAVRPLSTMTTVEEAKRNAAKVAVANHYPKDAKWVGIGSGTTIVYVVEAIKELGVDTTLTRFVPTGHQSKQLITSAGLTAVEFDAIPEGTVLDVAFDGADEVDDELNCIKGGGACLFQEKIVALQAKEFICVADSRKLQSRLLTSWKYIPIEVAPIAVYRVQRKLKELGSINPAIRLNAATKEGPLRTDQGFFIIDAPFPPLLTQSDVKAGKDGSGKAGIWEVETLSKAIKQIPGVLEVGIFSGLTGPQAQAAGAIGGQKPVAAYFGMPDGSVTVRKAAVA
ncbi:Ribose-5-phosphate isomerase [Rasamsonia emersonii CBS 393.64]|uniref:Ribose-5-phosphate isomerase n=1 Tax=Rasamsonia emersonii (strain ATCC 16479 / CBS 393.64 / IMI 116815) TaxID=1408163 RepID=A0A0F4Z117_RASE3|nr:Ribose-5-phosphate isomerase [Rasamsonia emersonii CBS 393.64]KKA24065.1 Ribose-5-phosphate isomerase [Rasamsonia emersonii CBS 393.64]